MSRKVQSFTAVIAQPLNVYNFELSIPQLVGSDVPMIVESTVFPGADDQLQNIVKWYKGEEIHYPTIPKMGHVWNFNVPEGDSGIVSATLNAVRNSMYDQTTGALLPTMWQDIIVASYPQNHVHGDNIPPVFQAILHGAWLRGRGNVNLNASQPTGSWNTEYSWVYQWLEDVPGAFTGSPIQY